LHNLTVAANIHCDTHNPWRLAENAAAQQQLTGIKWLAWRSGTLGIAIKRVKPAIALRTSNSIAHE
jgi:hypothetical protein